LQPFDNVLQQHTALWQAWWAERSDRYAVPLDVPRPLADEFLVSTIVLRSHLDKTFPGAMVASLSIRAIVATSAAATIWSGRAIWSRPPVRCWRSAPIRRRATPCAI
jgi:hypothetical protein